MQRIPAIVLAAGESSRMGVPKQLLPYRGTHLLGRAIHSAAIAGFSPVAVVVGCRAMLIQNELRGYNVHFVLNRDWREGMASSVRAGVTAIVSMVPRCEAGLILLSDQPELGPKHFRELRRRWSRPEGCIAVASEYENRIGVPAIIGRELFRELLALTGDIGARDVLRRHSDRIARISTPEASADIDTPEQYHRLLAAH